MNNELIYNVNETLLKYKFNQHLNDVCMYPKFFDAIKHSEGYVKYQSKYDTYQGQIEAHHTEDGLNGDQLFHLNALQAGYLVDRVPGTYKAAMKSNDREIWQEAMDRELASLRDHKTYDLVEPPNNVGILPGRWVFSLTRDR